MKRLFTNTTIQKRITSIISKLPLEELKQFEDKAFTKKKFDINFALIVKVPIDSNEGTKQKAIKDHLGNNRWTWKYKFCRDDFLYAICTQWYVGSDKYVHQWLMEHDINYPS